MTAEERERNEHWLRSKVELEGEGGDVIGGAAPHLARVLPVPDTGATGAPEQWRSEVGAAIERGASLLEAERVQCTGYTLTVTNDPDEGRSLALVVHDARGRVYRFRASGRDDRPGLVTQMLETLTVWPDRSFFVTVQDEEITSFSRT